MKIIIIGFFLIGAISASPISYNGILESRELDTNMTEILSLSQSSENDTSELQSSEENTSHQSSESESSESTSEENTSEESDSQSDEDDQTDLMIETRDNSIGSEENVRKSWVRVFANVVKVLSAEDNSSTEVKSQSERLHNQLTIKQATPTSTSKTLKQKIKTLRGHTGLPVVENPSDSSDTTSDSTDSDITGMTAATSDSSDSSDSSESTSSESNETSETSDSKSTEDSNASDSTELEQIKSKDCVNGTQSCESEEYLFQVIGDDAHFPLNNLMESDGSERELSLRR